MAELCLNSAQIEAIRHNEGPMLVLAGPGSGKTTVIAHRLKYLIVDCGVRSSNILVINFTKAATNETMKRCKALIGCGHHIHISTFHSFFFKILKAHTGVEINNILLDNEKRDILRTIITKSGLSYLINEDFLQNLEDEISLIKNDLLDVRFYNSMVTSSINFKKILTLYEDYKKRSNKLDFDDMLEKCYALLSENQDILTIWQKRYQYILIDEFQDINAAQYNCMKLIAWEHRNIFAVGDDDQSIYRFRGARPEIMFNFEKVFADAKRVILNYNYRSTDEIIHFAANIIRDNKNRFQKNIKGTGRNGTKPLIMVSADVSAEAVNISRKILADVHGDFNEVCVLYRTNAQSRAFADVFMEQKIPFIIKDGGPSVYEHWLAKDICAYLRLAVNRQHNESLVRIINKPNRYLSKTLIADAKTRKVDLLDYLFNHSGLQIWQLSKFEDMMYKLNELKTKNTSSAIRYIRRDIGYDMYIKDYAEYRKMDAKPLFEILNELSDAAKNYDKINDFLEHADKAIEENMVKMKKESENAVGVTLSTMHGVKGLEFEKVFVASCIDGLVPYKKSRTAAEIEEERRLLYVAVTRAKDELYISVVKSRYDKEVKPSPFLNFCNKFS